MENDPLAQLQTREIEKTPQPPEMFPELVDALSRLCFTEDKKQNVDVIFVFGSNIIQQQLAKKISKLLEEGLSKKVIISGGIASYENIILPKLPESEIILSHIPVHQFGDITFIKEVNSKNSLENVLETSLIYDFSKDNSILFLSHSYASTRSKLTLKKICSEHQLISHPYDIPSESKRYPISRKHWWKTIYGQAVVWGEFLRIIKYGEREDFPVEDVREQLKEIKHLLGQRNVAQFQYA